MKYDLIIIGGGPIGISMLYRFINTKYNVLLIEKENLFNSFYHMDKNMIWHSPINGCNLKENQFSESYSPTVSELIKNFKLFVKENIDDKYYKINEKVTLINKNENYYNILTKKNKYITKAIYIATRTNFSVPTSVNFQIINSNVNRHLTDSSNIEGKKICVIGGGWTSADAVVALQEKNNVTIITRNYKKFKDKHREQKAIYGHKDFDIKYKYIQYNKIYEIKNNKINVDNNILEFDIYYIFFGYSHNNNIKIDCDKEKIFDNSQGKYIDLLENVYGCTKDHTKHNGRYIVRTNTIDSVIKLIENALN